MTVTPICPTCQTLERRGRPRLVDCRRCRLLTVGSGKQIPGLLLVWLANEMREADNPTAAVVVENLVLAYERDRPCHYLIECLTTGRCPRDPVCNN